LQHQALAIVGLSDGQTQPTVQNFQISLPAPAAQGSFADMQLEGN
jgi:hypothetical protein